MAYNDNKKRLLKSAREHQFIRDSFQVTLIENIISELEFFMLEEECWEESQRLQELVDDFWAQQKGFPAHDDADYHI